MIFKPMKSTVLTAFLLLPGLLAPVSAMDVEYPLIQALVHYPYQEFKLLPKSEYTLLSNLNYSNIFVFDQGRTLISDMELISNTLSFRYGLHPKIKTFALSSKVFHRSSCVETC